MPTCQEEILNHLAEAKCQIGLILSKSTFFVAVRERTWSQCKRLLEKCSSPVRLLLIIWDRLRYKQARLRCYLAAVRKVELQMPHLHKEAIAALPPSPPYAEVLAVFPHLTWIIDGGVETRVYSSGVWSRQRLRIGRHEYTPGCKAEESLPSKIGPALPVGWEVDEHYSLFVQNVHYKINRQTTLADEPKYRSHFMDAYRRGIGACLGHISELNSDVALHTGDLVRLCQDRSEGERNFRIPTILHFAPMDDLDSSQLSTIATLVPLGLRDLHVGIRRFPNRESNNLKDILEATKWESFRGLRTLLVSITGPCLIRKTHSGETVFHKCDWSGMRTAFDIETLFSDPPLNLETLTIRLFPDVQTVQVESNDFERSDTYSLDGSPTLRQFVESVIAIGGRSCKYHCCIYGAARYGLPREILMETPFDEEVKRQLDEAREAEGVGWTWLKKDNGSGQGLSDTVNSMTSSG